MTWAEDVSGSRDIGWVALARQRKQRNQPIPSPFVRFLDDAARGSRETMSPPPSKAPHLRFHFLVCLHADERNSLCQSEP